MGFFTWYTDLPSDSGYAHFSLPHLFMMAVLLLCGFLLARHHEKQNEAGRIRELHILSIVPLIMECVRDLLMYFMGNFRVQYLPLHLCGQAILLEAVHGVLKEDRLKLVLGELLFVLFLPGAMCAILFPDWSDFYPLWNCWSLNSYFTHFFLVMYALLLYQDKKVQPCWKHAWTALVYLLASAAVIGPLDVHWNADFMFLIHAPAPLDVIQNAYGQAAYLAVLACTGSAMPVLMYGIHYLIQKNS